MLQTPITTLNALVVHRPGLSRDGKNKIVNLTATGPQWPVTGSSRAASYPITNDFSQIATFCGDLDGWGNQHTSHLKSTCTEFLTWDMNIHSE